MSSMSRWSVVRPLAPSLASIFPPVRKALPAFDTLLPAGVQYNIAGTIIARVSKPTQRCTSRTWTHVLQEVLEAVPASANFDACASVIFVVLVTASSHHLAPR